MSYCFAPIGIFHSCFKEKFGIPRQPGLVPEAQGRLEMLPPYNRREAFQALESYSHLWLVFAFHQAMQRRWSPTVRPPRLGGNRRVGVFASRSPFRPNPIGLSPVQLLAIDYERHGVSLRLGGIDLLDRTPILDIKPYLPYADRLAEATGGYAQHEPRNEVRVEFSAAAAQSLQRLEPAFAEHLRRLIGQLLAQDPRPAYLHDNPRRRHFGMRLYDLNIRWRVEAQRVLVTAIAALGNDPG